MGGFDFKWSGEHTSLSPEEPPGSGKRQFPDANPYAVLATGDGFYVVDAAFNTVDWVTNGGKVRIVAFIPNPPVSDAVPTCVAKGRDGALYVGQLTGGGNARGAASIWRVEPWDGDVNKWATGLTAITGCDRPRNARGRRKLERDSPIFSAESGERVSNPRPRAWEARALPAELSPPGAPS